MNWNNHLSCLLCASSRAVVRVTLQQVVLAGPLSSIWREWVNWCVEFGIEADSIVAVPYDWRLSASMLEERDLYFHKLKLVHPTTAALVDCTMSCLDFDA